MYTNAVQTILFVGKTVADGNWVDVRCDCPKKLSRFTALDMEKQGHQAFFERSSSVDHRSPRDLGARGSLQFHAGTVIFLLALRSCSSRVVLGIGMAIDNLLMADPARLHEYVVCIGP